MYLCTQQIKENMTKQEFEIKITGSGTPLEIASALEEISKSIKESADSEHGNAVLDGAEWETSILMTEIKSL